MIQGALDPVQFAMLISTLWVGIATIIGCTYWAVMNLKDKWEDEE